MERSFKADQWEWTTLLNLSEKNLKEQMDKLTRCIERVRQCNERAESCRYKAMTFTQDSEYIMKDYANASQSMKQSMRDCLEILTEGIPVNIDLLQSALCKGLLTDE